VLIDGVDLALVDVAWLRRQVGVVLQENVLFNRSVRDNIAPADPAMSMERVARGPATSDLRPRHHLHAAGLRTQRTRHQLARVPKGIESFALRKPAS
jgi:ABC-type transport system involved in Fe-S cluster assembly fused permease/ATPase subunit